VYLTTEVRWFERGSIPPSMMIWFSEIHPKIWIEAEHTDYYYSLPDDDSIGIKLRQNRVEIKKRHLVAKPARLTSQVSGKLETWEKWGIAPRSLEFNFTEIATDPIWVGVRKRRNLQRYQLTESLSPIPIAYHRRVAQGFALELSQITVRQADWWTIAFEFFRITNFPLSENKNIISGILLSMPSLRLDSQSSFGYPQFLNYKLAH
jgi:hypothetical protein